MPTTVAETPLADPPFEREVADKLTFRWRRHGAEPSHVLTRFTGPAGERVYSGPFPLGGDRSPEQLPAFVTCQVSRERDHALRAGYAAAVRALLGTRIPADRTFVAIQPVDPADHFTPGTTRPEPSEENQ